MTQDTAFSQLPPEVESRFGWRIEGEYDDGPYGVYLLFIINQSVRLLRARLDLRQMGAAENMAEYVSYLSENLDALDTKPKRLTPRQAEALEVVKLVIEVFIAATLEPFSQVRFGLANLQLGMRASALRSASLRSSGASESARSRSAWKILADREYERLMLDRPGLASTDIAEIIHRKGIGAPSEEAVLKFVRKRRRLAEGGIG